MATNKENAKALLESLNTQLAQFDPLIAQAKLDGDKDLARNLESQKAALTTKIAGAIIDVQDYVKISIKIPRNKAQKVSQQAIEDGISEDELVRRAINQYLRP